MKCQVDTCGENRESGEPWDALWWVAQGSAPDDLKLRAVCDAHAEGWYDGSDGWLPRIEQLISQELRRANG